MELRFEDAVAKYYLKKISLKEVRRLINENGGEEGFWQPAEDRRPMLEKLTLEEAFVKFRAKEITVDEFSEIMVRNGKRHEFYLTAEDRNPRYPEGDNSSRAGFTWNPYTHIKGKFYQNVVKKVVYNAINFAHEAMPIIYDKDIYTYSDPRLVTLNTFAKAYIIVNTSDAPGYKGVFLTKLIDIVLGMVAKEDLYYCALLFDFINAFTAQFPNGFQLTKEEIENIETWHRQKK